MKNWILFFILIPLTLYSQRLPEESKRWLSENLLTKNVDSNELIQNYFNYNFNVIWLSHQDATIGFIGDNYQRIYIHFKEIVKSETLPTSYLVKGKSKLKNNICNIDGQIKILHIKRINKNNREVKLNNIKKQTDSVPMNLFKKEQFIILAEYNFNEYQNNKLIGAFIGILKSCFYVLNDSIYYDDLERGYSDSFANNLFVGIWKSYSNSKIEERSNWGNFRIPYSGDLDIGAGDFSPNDKYLQFGWEIYRKAYFKGDPNAVLEEKKRWW